MFNGIVIGMETGPEIRMSWALWGARWMWLLLGALILATTDAEAGLWLIALYAALQLGLTFALLWQAPNRIVETLSLAFDLTLPPAIISLSSGFPSALWGLTLAGVLSLGLVRGAFGAWSGLLIGAGLSWLGLALSLGGVLSAGLLSAVHLIIVLPGVFVLARLAARVTPLLKGRSGFKRQRERWLGSLLEIAGERDWGTSLSPNQILRSALEEALNGLISAGTQPEGLGGVALRREGTWLEVIHRSGTRWHDRLRVHAGTASEDGSDEIEAEIQEGPGGLGQEIADWLEAQGWPTALQLQLHSNGLPTFVLLFGHRDPEAFDENSRKLLKRLASELLVALRMSGLYRSLIAERDRLGEIQEEARRKLARDLHDGPTQVIAAIAMRTNFARRQLKKDPGAASQELEKVESMARATTKEIRNMLFSLRPLILESQGLCAALGQYADKVRDTHGQKLALDLDTQVEDELSAESQSALFYIVEEAVTNGLKHAAASVIQIRLLRSGEEILVEVEDDGVGFNVGAVDANYEQRGSLGMVTMRERAQLLQGTLHVWSEEGAGTRIQVRVPVASDARPESGTSPELSNAP